MSTYADCAVEFARRAKGNDGRIPDEALLAMTMNVYGNVPGLRERMVEEQLIGDVSGSQPPQDRAERYAEILVTPFDPIIGYEDVKQLFLQALKASTPVHILLEGPPASAKSLFLSELGRLPGSHLIVGGTSSRAGITDALFTYQPSFLLVDEIETIRDPKDYAALLHLMESQEVVETKYHRHNVVALRTWVFAAANDVARLSEALLSRFGGLQGIVRFKPYRSDEYADVVTHVLVMREGVPEDFAKLIAKASLDLGSRDVRFAVRLARLAKSPEELEAVKTVFQQRR